jgi:hypothetical protein
VNKLPLPIVVFIILLISCQDKNYKYQKQIAVAKKLLSSFSKNDTLSVQSMMGVPLEEIGTNSEILNGEVKRGYNLIKQFGIPSEDKFVLKEYSEKNPELLDIVVPFDKKGKSKVKDASITIKFVKYLPPDKIIDFDIQATYEVMPTEPAPVDSARILK